MARSGRMFDRRPVGKDFGGLAPQRPVCVRVAVDSGTERKVLGQAFYDFAQRSSVARFDRRNFPRLRPAGEGCGIGEEQGGLAELWRTFLGELN